MPVYAQRSEKQGWQVKNYKESDARNYFDNNYYLDKVEGIWQSTDGFKYAIEKEEQEIDEEEKEEKELILKEQEAEARKYLEYTARLVEEMSDGASKQKIDEKLDYIFNKEKKKKEIELEYDNKENSVKTKEEKLKDLGNN